jgi:hypothetical protein
MRFHKNPDQETVEVDYEESTDPHEIALWYQQFVNLPEKKRKEIAEKAMMKIQDAKPDTYQFIKKFKCELVGVSPRIEYSLVDRREGDLEGTWIHSFSLPTLLFWCPDGKFSFFVNANLDFNDTVLNRQKGNKKQQLKGFTA